MKRKYMHLTLNLKPLVFTALILCLFSVAKAQHRTSAGLSYGGGGSGEPDPFAWGMSISGGYEALTGDARGTYAGAPVFSLSLTRNWNDFTFNGTIGYASHKPKSDTAFVYADDTEIGYVKYNDFNTLQFYVGAAYNIPVADIVKFYLGANLGAYRNSLSYVSSSADGTLTGNFSGTQAFFAPKAGFNFQISPSVSFSVEAKYNIVSKSSGTTSADSTSTSNYTYNIGSFKTFSVTGALNFLF
jgi:hypothetical protein